jgi:hypothetical protein
MSPWGRPKRTHGPASRRAHRLCRLRRVLRLLRGRGQRLRRAWPDPAQALQGVPPHPQGTRCCPSWGTPWRTPESIPRPPWGTPKSVPRPPWGTPKSVPRPPWGTPKSVPRPPWGTPESVLRRSCRQQRAWAWGCRSVERPGRGPPALHRRRQRVPQPHAGRLLQLSLWHGRPLSSRCRSLQFARGRSPAGRWRVPQPDARRVQPQGRCHPTGCPGAPVEDGASPGSSVGPCPAHRPPAARQRRTPHQLGHRP